MCGAPPSPPREERAGGEEVQSHASSPLTSRLRSQESSMFAGVLTGSRLPQPGGHPLDRSFRQSSGHGPRFLLPCSNLTVPHAHLTVEIAKMLNVYKGPHGFTV